LTDATTEAKPSKTAKAVKRGIGTVIREAILAGKSNEEALVAAKAEFPYAGTTVSTVSRHRSNLRKEGHTGVTSARELKKKAIKAPQLVVDVEIAETPAVAAAPAPINAAPARKYPPWKPSAWSLQFPQSYFTEMGRVIDDMTATWFSERDVDEGYADYVKVRHVFGRMEVAQQQIMPWVLQSIPDLADKTVLEIGCGTGPSTVPLALAAKHVHAFDLDAKCVAVAKQRMELLNINNVTLFHRTVDWTKAYANDSTVLSGPVDVILCYALLEHLLPLERMDLLVGAWKHLAVGGYLVIIECPNRLYPFDWHSSQLPFMDQLPEELSYLWNGFSSRSSIPKDITANSRAAAALCNRDRLYRFGRGASFHEFHVALGPDAYRVVNTQNPPQRSTFAGWNDTYIAMLATQLAALNPPVSSRFAQPCLDLVLQKTGAGRLT
jgi:2-polyprenyl-3-methyl-5-hydroxy-6-metoxy-1,4-benzoquinol methylase